MSVVRHPRDITVHSARANLRSRIYAWDEAHTTLTDAERIGIICDVLGSEINFLSKFLIREERHGDTDKPGGLA